MKKFIVAILIIVGFLFYSFAYSHSNQTAVLPNVSTGSGSSSRSSNPASSTVQFLQYPDDHNRSVMINQYADPQLTSEAIQAQSANVDIITGATDSSEAFIQSLTDALAQAKV